MFTLSQKFTKPIIQQILANPEELLNNNDKIDIKCKCGTITNITVRSLHRKWNNRPEYLCRSCHIKTYANDKEKIAKFKKSHALISKTEEHKKKCSKAGKKAWEKSRQKIIAAVSKDNKTNHKKKQARKLALNTLRNKPWFHAHMRKMGKLSKQRTRSTSEKFIERAISTHDDKYNYSQVTYVNKDTNVTIICKNHGKFYQTPHNHLMGKGCSRCRTIISRPHQTILEMFPKQLEIINNNRTILNPKEIDIFTPKHNLGIEINGEYWHGIKRNMTQTEKEYKRIQHSMKTELANATGIRLLQFWESEILNQTDLVKSMIDHILGTSNRVHARKCIIEKSDNRGFYDNSHLQGWRSSKISYLLKYQNEIVAGLSLSPHPKHQWEIIRYCCAKHTTVVGGFSRLLSSFVSEYKPTSILTFADRRFSNGNLYKQNGFKLLEITKPNYFYFIGRTILSRQQCQKHKLRKLLGDVFDPQLTETENMLKNKYVKVYDAGHCKFIKQI